MTARLEFSKQTLSVLAVLCAQPSAWQLGYAIARDTGLKSGTLYPILIRTSDVPPAQRHDARRSVVCGTPGPPGA